MTCVTIYSIFEYNKNEKAHENSNQSLPPIAARSRNICNNCSHCFGSSWTCIFKLVEMKLQISINMLERIIENAKNARRHNNSLSETVELEQVSESDGHITPDHIAARVKVNYSECDGELIFNNWQ